MKAEGNEISEEKHAVGEGIMSFREEQKAEKRKEQRKEGQGIELCRIGEKTRFSGRWNWERPGIRE